MGAQSSIVPKTQKHRLFQETTPLSNPHSDDSSSGSFFFAQTTSSPDPSGDSGSGSFVVPEIASSSDPSADDSGSGSFRFPSAFTCTNA